VNCLAELKSFANKSQLYNS